MNSEEDLTGKRPRPDLPGPSQLLEEQTEPGEKKIKLDEPEYNILQLSSLLGASGAQELDPFQTVKAFNEFQSQLPPLQVQDALSFERQLARDDTAETDTYQPAPIGAPDMEVPHHHLQSPRTRISSRPIEKEPEVSLDTLPPEQLRALAGLDPVVPTAQIPRRPSAGGRGRRKKVPLVIEEETDPDSKWNKSATEKLTEVYQDYITRRVVDSKFEQSARECLEKGANPAVTLVGADATSFFTILTVAADRGLTKLASLLLERFHSEFSDFDKKHALQAALRGRNQEIANLLIRDGAPIDRETLILMFDIQMSDELERKTLPMKAILERIDEGKFPAEEFFLPELLNRAIYADNVAALELLFEKAPDEIRALLEKPSPILSNNIRAGRGKAQDIGEGVPPLTFAAVMERGECLDVFLKNGADPNFTFEDMGGTLLHIVGFKNNYELIELLINSNADPRIANSRGITVLSRTKGRKARKFIRDACSKLDSLGKGINYEGTLLPPVSSALTDSSQGPPGSLMGGMHQELPLPPVYSHYQSSHQMQGPPLSLHQSYHSPLQNSLHQGGGLSHHSLHPLSHHQPSGMGSPTGLHSLHPHPNHHLNSLHQMPGNHQSLHSGHQIQSVLQSSPQMMNSILHQGYPPNPPGSE